MNQGQVLFLNEKEIESLITREETLEVVDQVFKAYAKGNAVNPVKLHLPIYPHYEGYINSMPSYNLETQATGVKMVSVYHDNLKNYGILTTLGTIVLHDPKTGMPYAIMGGTHITNMRTGAAAGLKVKYLAKKDASIMAVVGAGAQGYSATAMALTAMKGQIKELRVSDLNAARRAEFIEMMKAEFPEVTYISSESNAEAMKGAHVGLFCSGAPIPLLDKCELDPGVLVVGVAELVTPDTVARFDKFYTDFTDCVLERFNTLGREGAKKTGSVYVDLEEKHVTAEIGNVMAGLIPGRQSDDEKILTLDVGMSIEDVGVARLAFDKAMAQNVGKILDFQNL